MGNFLMPMIMAFGGVFMLTTMMKSCEDKDKAKNEAMINACLHDETGECQRKAAEFAEQNPQAADAAASQFMKTDADGNFVSTNTAMLQQAEKVQQGLEEDKNNPNSAYYEGPNTATERNLAGAEPTPVAILPASADGGGDASGDSAPASVGVLGQTTQ